MAVFLTRGVQRGGKNTWSKSQHFDYSSKCSSQPWCGCAGINPAALPRDPTKGCTPFYPHQYPKVNTIFEVRAAAPQQHHRLAKSVVEQTPY